MSMHADAAKNGRSVKESTGEEWKIDGGHNFTKTPGTTHLFIQGCATRTSSKNPPVIGPIAALPLQIRSQA
jgi:hypothetical protein